VKLIMLWVDYTGHGDVDFAPVLAPDTVVKDDLKLLEREHLKVCSVIASQGGEVYRDGEGAVRRFARWLIEEKGFKDAESTQYEVENYL
jgi:hypothetical protein